jgi:hypothetical protein
VMCTAARAAGQQPHAAVVAVRRQPCPLPPVPQSHAALLTALLTIRGPTLVFLQLDHPTQLLLLCRQERGRIAPASQAGQLPGRVCTRHQAIISDTAATVHGNHGTAATHTAVLLRQPGTRSTCPAVLQGLAACPGWRQATWNPAQHEWLVHSLLKLHQLQVPQPTPHHSPQKQVHTNPCRATGSPAAGGCQPGVEPTAASVTQPSFNKRLQEMAYHAAAPIAELQQLCGEHT